jgi:thioesterase domain-containing protein
MARIEKTFNQTLPLTTLFQENTIERLALVLQQNRDVPFAPLVPIQPDGHQPPFFCVHAAGGHIFRYINLARHLGPEQPVYGLQAVELDDKQSPQIKVEQMAATYIEAIRAVQPEGPYLLGGWSMGGTIAYEMAQQLQKQQQQVGLLALFDTVAIVPPLPDTNINKFLLGNFAYDLGLLPTQFTVSQKQFQHLSADSILHAVWEQGGIANIFPPDIHFSQVRRMFNTYKANVQAAQQYIPAAYSGRLVLFKASAQLDNDVQESGRHWHSLAKDGLEVYSVPGDHITMLDEQHVSVLAAHLRTFLHGEKASDQL